MVGWLALPSDLPSLPASSMTTRRRAREIVLQLLYEDDLNPDQNLKIADQFLVARMLGNGPLVQFARDLVSNVRRNRRRLDQSLSAIAVNWSLRRMAAIDRNILRLAAYEILMTQTPGPVVINEAIEIAKRYGDKNSGQFVNGVLDRMLRDRDSKRESSSDEPGISRQAASAGTVADD